MEAIKIFYSYSSKNDEEFKKLKEIMTPIKKNIQIIDWNFRENQGGDLFQNQINKKMEGADVFIFLLSSAFFGSNECQKELDYAIDNREDKGIHIIPIILSPCAWRDNEYIKEIQALPQDGMPVSSKEWNTPDEAWENIRQGLMDKFKKINKDKPFTIKPEFMDFLQKIEYIDVNDNVSLDKLYVPPTILAVQQANLFEIDDACGEIMSFRQGKRVMIYGESFSGKTTLAKKIFLEALSQKMIPLYLDSKVTHKIKKENIIENVFLQQYDNKSYASYTNSTNSDKIIIIDNYGNLNSSQQKRILEGLQDECSIFCFVQEDEYINYYCKDSLLSSFDIFSISECGRVKQNSCIKNWIALRDTNVTDYEEDRLTDNINRIFSSKIIPAYPYFIYSTLQIQENFMPSDMRITQYGDCFHALIVARLIKSGINGQDIDSYLNFFTFFAYHSFKNQTNSFSINDMMNFISEYSDDESDGYNLPTRTPQDLIKKIINNEHSLLKKTHADYYFFDVEYVYYFFLGRYLSGNLNSTIIAKLCEKIYKRECMFSLVFMIHHAKNIDALDELIVRGMCQYENKSEITLDVSETNFAINISNVRGKIDVNIRPEKERKRQLKENDNIDTHTMVQEREIERIAEHDDAVREMMTCIKTMEVLGQIIKNHSGSLQKNKIKEIIDTSQNMGLRFCHDFVQLMQTQEFIDYFKNRVKNNNKEYTNEKIRKLANIYTLMLTISILNKISYEIANDKCLDIISRVCKDTPTPARKIIHYITKLRLNWGLTSNDLPNKNLIKEISDRLEQETVILLDEFEGNFYAQNIIKFIAANYVHTHTIESSQKQKLLHIVNKDNLKDIKNKKRKY